jgi:hypothetical protein
MQEKDFYNESETKKPAQLHCPYCKQTQEYSLRWVLRQKKANLPGRGDERDRAQFAKAQSYMVLRDDKVRCANARCRKTFDISGMKTVVLL